jgi:septum formation protein
VSLGAHIILASQSAGRLHMLRNAGVQVEPQAPMLDETTLIQGLKAEGAKPRAIADQLAEAKAIKVSRKFPTGLVLGTDQILVTDDSQILEKPENAEQAIEHLTLLSGKTHRLISAAVFCESGNPVWRHSDTARLTMRPLSPTFIQQYVADHWDAIRHCVGCYRIEAEGAQLFASVSGSQFTIIGLPLLAVLDYLRPRDIMPS